MTGASTPARHCTIYRSGEAPAQEVHHPTGADTVTLGEIMSRDLVCARPNLEIEAVIGLMIDNHLGCIPVVDEQGRPIGMITKFDIVEQLNAFLRAATSGSPLPLDLAARTAEEVMMPIALTLGETSTLGDAASMMTCEDLHHVLVISSTGALVGVISTKDIVTWLARNDGLMPFT